MAVSTSFLQALYAEGVLSGDLPASESIRARARHVAEASGHTFVTEGAPFFRKGSRWKVGPVQYKAHTRFYAQTQAIRENFLQRAQGIWGTADIAPQRIENLTAVMQAHEAAEAFYMNKGAQFGSHASEAVIQSELEVARRMGPQTAADVVRYRRWESSQLADLPTHQTAYWNRYTERMDEILSRFERTSLPKAVSPSKKFSWKLGLGIGAAALLAGGLLGSAVPERNKGYYSFDGFTEEGVGPKQRKVMTEFGSGWFRKMGRWVETFVAGRGIRGLPIMRPEVVLKAADLRRLPIEAIQTRLASRMSPEAVIGTTVGGPVLTRQQLASMKKGQIEGYFINVESRISGMHHGGMAASKRRLTTDHGSPWKGLFGGVSRRITKYLGKKAAPGAAKLLDPRKAAKMAEGRTLEQFAEAIGSDIRVVNQSALRKAEQAVDKAYSVAPRTATGELTAAGEQMIDSAVIRKIDMEHLLTQQAEGTLGAAGVTRYVGGKEIAYIDPAQVRSQLMESVVQRGFPKDVAARVAQNESILKTAVYHELLEKQAMGRFGTKALMRGPTVEHAAGQVILGEAGFIKAVGDKELQRFFTTLRKTKIEKKTFAAGLEAFGEEGSAPALRKLTTDFGSGWRGVKASVSKVRAQTMSSSNRVSKKLTQTSKDLKIAQENLWEWSRSGGEGHIRPTGRHVTQISSDFGGNL